MVTSTFFFPLHTARHRKVISPWQAKDYSALVPDFLILHIGRGSWVKIKCVLERRAKGNNDELEWEHGSP